jgi:RHS repeat-associated protein
MDALSIRYNSSLSTDRPQACAADSHASSGIDVACPTTQSVLAIAELYAYSAYGQPTILDASASVLSSSAINNRYTYTGREWDATLGLHHFRARWMSPSAGRFLGRDPIGYDISSLLYDASFMVVGLDPSGESPCSENPLSTGVPCSAAEARQAVGRCARECAANGYTYRGEGLICCTKGVGRGVIKACSQKNALFLRQTRMCRARPK